MELTEVAARRVARPMTLPEEGLMSTYTETRLDELTEILSWRYESLLDAGYPDREALLLATRDDVDLHLACDLLARGCPARTAVQILV